MEAAQYSNEPTSAKGSSYFVVSYRLMAAVATLREKDLREGLVQLNAAESLGPAVMTIEGYGSEAVAQTLGCAEKLAREMDDKPGLHSTLFGLRAFHQLRGELDTAKNYGSQCIELARQLNDATLLVQSQTCMAHTLYILGEFSAARSYVAEAVSGLEAVGSDDKAYDAIGLHPKAWCPALASWIE